MADKNTFVTSHESIRTAAHWAAMGLSIAALIVMVIAITAPASDAARVATTAAAEANP